MSVLLKYTYIFHLLLINTLKFLKGKLIIGTLYVTDFNLKNEISIRCSQAILLLHTFAQ